MRRRSIFALLGLVAAPKAAPVETLRASDLWNISESQTRILTTELGKLRHEVLALRHGQELSAKYAADQAYSVQVLERISDLPHA